MKYTIRKNENFREDMSYKELRQYYNKYSNNIEEYVLVNKTDESISIKLVARRLHFVGRKHFVKNEELKWFLYKNKKIYGNGLSNILTSLHNFNHDSYVNLLNEIGLSWMRDLSSELIEFACKPSIFKSILLNNIYSEETLVKAVGRRIFKLKTSEFSWKTLKKYLESHHRCSIFMLKDFTENLNNSMERLNFISSTKEYSTYSLICDLIRMAADEDSIVDLTWSVKRIELEHKKQIERALEIEINEKSVKELYQDIVKSKLENNQILLLSNEKDIFLEGKSMHHCLYNCYYNNIKNYNYMAFHMNAPESCTFGVVKRNGEITLDQIYLKYDKDVSEETENLALDFINKNSEIISSQIREQKNPVSVDRLPF